MQRSPLAIRDQPDPEPQLRPRIERAERQASGRPWLDRLSIAILAFAAYVLSIGPLYWQWYSSLSGHGHWFFAVFYRPLQILAILVPRFGQWLDWYVSLWIY